MRQRPALQLRQLRGNPAQRFGSERQDRRCLSSTQARQHRQRRSHTRRLEVKYLCRAVRAQLLWQHYTLTYDREHDQIVRGAQKDTHTIGQLPGPIGLPFIAGKESIGTNTVLGLRLKVVF
jgi:hypothetical protein